MEFEETRTTQVLANLRAHYPPQLQQEMLQSSAQLQFEILQSAVNTNTFPLPEGGALLTLQVCIGEASEYLLPVTLLCKKYFYHQESQHAC